MLGEKKKMTKQQAEAYDSFIEFMVELYKEYGHILGNHEEEKKE